MEEELDFARRKVLRLQAQKDGSSVVDEPHQELREYREIVKCNICLDLPKELKVVTHLRRKPICPLSLQPSFFQANVVTHLRPNPSVLCLPLKLHQRHLTVVCKAGFAVETAVSATRLRLDNLGQQPGSRKRAKRKGRGHAAGQGGSCGFGMRGQKSKSSPGVRRGFEGGQMPLYRRIPKLRGIAGGMHAGLPKYVPVNLKDIVEAGFQVGEEVSLETLKKKGLINPSGRERKLPLKLVLEAVRLCFLAVEILLGPGSATSENTQKKFLDVKRLSLQVRESLEELQSKVDKSRLAIMGVFIELEKERFDKKRMEEELDIARRKVLRLLAQKVGSSVVDELRQELREYREIGKCNTCLDRPKEVVITKFYHLFCNPCSKNYRKSSSQVSGLCCKFWPWECFFLLLIYDTIFKDI
ncbi:hypothetical protein LWI29_017014 [Acer saccharum]|uniref:Ribosomal protein L18e/L15P domain-containing protein n=1 Tax=Acer saccharum TaxID=4024 RepID=A0AA39W1C1_ACESA|nr:hypothetical protein LWI29_017014 [Acer saccharum]